MEGGLEGLRQKSNEVKEGERERESDGAEGEIDSRGVIEKTKASERESNGRMSEHDLNIEVGKERTI